MNERIRELADQAELNATLLFNKEKLEKFAELIVKEVLAVQEKLIADGHNAWHLHSPTKEHFGVDS